MDRVKPRFKPQFDLSLKNWIFKQIALNRWRIGLEYDNEDLFEEGVLLFYELKQKYPDVNNQKHFVGLFKRAYCNRIHDLAFECHVGLRQACQVSNSEQVLELFDLVPAKSYAAENDMRQLMATAPKPIQRLLEVLHIRQDFSRGIRYLYELYKPGSEPDRYRRYRQIMGLPAWINVYNLIHDWIYGKKLNFLLESES